MTTFAPGIAGGKPGTASAPAGYRVPPVEHRFKPGVRDPRAGPGRPPGLARYVRRLTGDGRELVDLQVAIMRDDVVRVYAALARKS